MNYKAIYKRLMVRGKRRDKPLVAERHHIKPKCLNGSDHKVNLVYLTPEEHYLAHQLLVKLHPDNKDILWAAFAMTGLGRGNKRQGNKLYGWLRRRFIERQTGRQYSLETRKKISETITLTFKKRGHPRLGKTFTKASRKRMSIAICAAYAEGRGLKKGVYKRSAEVKAHLSRVRKQGFATGVYTNPFPKGSRHSEETKQKMRAWWQARREARALS